ncbi:hypothetical protein DL764_001092 [Monosporascus ibericus]|uniref:Uncharacterized protein n=1 Tax=Monosporascus ibericus TaxID=155417 RepID=A0A4Q4TUD4_9PEZI|nr:hypothetical protein DL764_001092 [Monosporascus ibericus]
MKAGTNSSDLGLTMADDLPKLFNFLHGVLLATVVRGLPATLTMRDEELDRYLCEHLHEQIPEYLMCNAAEGARGRTVMYNRQQVRQARHCVPERDRASPAWRGPCRLLATTASFSIVTWTIGVITRDATVVNRENDQRWHSAVLANQ